MDENKIIQACLAGDADAFEQLVEHYQSRVIALAWNILGDYDDARDAAQDAFIQAIFIRSVKLEGKHAHSYVFTSKDPEMTMVWVERE